MQKAIAKPSDQTRARTHVARKGNNDFPQYVETLPQVAEFFGVSLSTVKDWRAAGMPGVAGLGAKLGSFDVREVARWRISKITERSPGAEQLARLEAAKRAGEIKIQNIKIKQLEEQLIDIDIVEHLITRLVVEHNAIADELAERVRQLIPSVGSTVKANDASEIAANVAELVDELRRAMALGLEEWAREIESGEADGGTTDGDD